MWTLLGNWTSNHSRWQKEDESAEKSSTDEDMDRMNPLRHSDPMWWAIGSWSSFHHHQRDAVLDPVHSMSRNAWASGDTSSPMVRCTMQDGSLGFSQQNMEKSFFLTGMIGQPLVPNGPDTVFPEVPVPHGPDEAEAEFLEVPVPHGPDDDVHPQHQAIAEPPAVVRRSTRPSSKPPD